jgi:septation ring formation regulator EzrA
MSKKIKREKYDYSNVEAQELFKQFTILLGDITKYVEEQSFLFADREEKLNKGLHDLQERYEKLEKDVVRYRKGEVELAKKIENMSRGRYMVKALIKKIYRFCLNIILFFPRKLKGKFKQPSK